MDEGARLVDQIDCAGGINGGPGPRVSIYPAKIVHISDGHGTDAVSRSGDGPQIVDRSVIEQQAISRSRYRRAGLNVDYVARIKDGAIAVGVRGGIGDRARAVDDRAVDRPGRIARRLCSLDR